MITVKPVRKINSSSLSSSTWARPFLLFLQKTFKILFNVWD
jgi:hypothetical protein